jgi:hypothetical protein
MFLLGVAATGVHILPMHFLASLLLPVSLLQASLLLQVHSSCCRCPADAANPAFACVLFTNCHLLSFHAVFLQCSLNLKQSCFEAISLFMFPELLMIMISGPPRNKRVILSVIVQVFSALALNGLKKITVAVHVSHRLFFKVTFSPNPKPTAIQKYRKQ